MRHNREQYFAMIAGEYLTVTVGLCSTCGAPFLTTDGDTHPTNRLLVLPNLGATDAPDDGYNAQSVGPARRRLQDKTTAQLSASD